ncbi:MAG TPA: SemiSWEET family transporter [Candidatus Methanoperedens sp.]
MHWYLIGITAALLTTFGFVPQIIKIHRTKSSKDVSLATLFQFSAGVALWTLYGFHIGDTIIIAANTISFITLVVSIVLYYHYRGK